MKVTIELEHNYGFSDNKPIPSQVLGLFVRELPRALMSIQEAAIRWYQISGIRVEGD